MSTHELSRGQLAEVYRDIVRGYSIAHWAGKPLYVKHLSSLDQIGVQEYEEEQRRAALARGVPSREDKEAWLLANELWGKRQEEDLVQNQDYLKGLVKTRERLYLEHQLAQHDQTIADARKVVNEMSAKKEGLFGLTAEGYAAQRVQFHHMQQSLFKDRTMETLLLDDAALKELDEEDSYALLTLFVDVVMRFAPETIRRCSIAPYFTGPFYLCGDDTTAFLGKPMVDITIYQNNLLNSGLHFKQVFMREDVPADIRADPAKIDEYIQKSANMKEIARRTSIEGGSTAIINATSRDFKAAGLKEDRGRAMNLDKE